jgi:N4-gp56 family major capsid protein
MSDPITQYYADNPLEILDKNQREWYDPDLVDMWRKRSVFRDLVKFTKNLGDVRATTMTISSVMDAHPDYTPLAVRQIWMPAMHIDSRSVEVTFAHYGSKVAYHKYDDAITYWKQNGKAGLRNILRGALGQSEVDINDYLARNALIKGALDTGFSMYAGTATDFQGLGKGDKFDPDIAADIWLGMSMRDVPGAMGPSGAGNSIVCYTSPGVIYDIQSDASWIAAHNYANDTAMLNYEAGAYKNVRYVQTPKCVLWNAGEVLVRAEISAAATAGDGAPDPSTTKVDGTYLVGQTSNGIVHYLQLAVPTTGSLSQISVNDIITIHKTTTSAYGVTDGVAPFEGTAMYRRVVAINTGTRRITLDQPILLDYDVDLGSGVYGYITLGRHIHTSIFVGGPNALVAGVAEPPRFYELDPIDDYKAIFRFSWDERIGYQPWNPEVFEVYFSAGSMRLKGETSIQ